MEPLDDMDETASESNDGTEHTAAATATPGKVFKYEFVSNLAFSVGLAVEIFFPVVSRCGACLIFQKEAHDVSCLNGNFRNW